MIPCISQVTTLSTPFEEDLAAHARAGWPAVELWLTKLETYLESHSIQDARRLLEASGLRALAASSQGGLLLTRGEERQAHRDQLRRRLEWLAELSVPTLIVAADLGSDRDRDVYGAAAEALHEAGTMASSLGVRLALECQKESRFCASLDTALALASEAGVGVCLDLFHFYCGPSKHEDLSYLTRDLLAWVQLCDLSGVPREVARDSDRILPGEGDLQLAPILDHLARVGYDGGVSLELFNAIFWQTPAEVISDTALRSMQGVLSRQATVPIPGGS